MNTFTAVAMPVIDVDEWRTYVDSIVTGDRREGHREFLRRVGVTREHIFHQPTPGTDLMVLVWEGVDPERALTGLAQVFGDPKTEHERYMRDYVIARLHGIDLTGASPNVVKLGTIEA